MRIMMVRTLCLLALLLFTQETTLAAAVPQQPEFDEKAVRARVAGLFSDRESKKFVRETDDLLWLRMMEEQMTDPDVRLFFLADMASGEWETDGKARALLLQDKRAEAGKENPALRSFTYSPDKQGGHITYDRSPDPEYPRLQVLEYSARKARDGSIWGSSQEFYSDGREQYESLRVFRVIKTGQKKKSFVWLTLPSLPQEKDFFRKGGFVQPQKGDKNYRVGLGPCGMVPRFKISDGKAPFGLEAVLEQTGNEQPSYLCRAECSIPYRWDGKQYRRAKPVCKDKEEWGVSLPDNS